MGEGAWCGFACNEIAGEGASGAVGSMCMQPQKIVKIAHLHALVAHDDDVHGC